MASAPFVIERKVQYHGIWNTGLQVTDQFLKGIAQQFDSKPSCPTFVTLNVNSITLQVLTRNGDKELHRDQIAFDALREIAVNSYNPKCLMILYINNKNRYSVIVCSCQDGKEATNISLAYKQLKNYRLVNPNKNNHIKQNWTLMKSTRDSTSSDAGDGDGDTISTRSRTVSGVMSESFAFLNSEDVSLNGDGDEDVFGGAEVVDRQPASGTDGDSYHVGLQVDLEDTSYAGGSVSSRSSVVSFQPVADEVKVVGNGTSDSSSTGIGQAEFFNLESVEEPTEDEENDNHQNDEDTGEESESPSTISKTVKKMVTTEDNETANYRSISCQTESFGLARRYKKRVGSQHTPNAYRDMAAQRKGTNINGSTESTLHGSSSNGSLGGSTNGSAFSGSTNGSSFRSINIQNSMPTSGYSSFTSSSNGNFLRAKSSSISSGVPQRSFRGVQTSSSSVSRPIEDVYRSWSRGKRTEGQPRGRRVVMYAKPRM